MPINRDLVASLTQPTAEVLSADPAVPLPSCPCVTSVRQCREVHQYQGDPWDVLMNAGEDVRQAAHQFDLELGARWLEHEAYFVEAMKLHLPGFAVIFDLVATHIWEDRREECAVCMAGPIGP